MLVSGIVVADGSGLTVIVTVSDLLQPVAVIVSVSLIAVVVRGVTIELEEVEVNPDGLLVHE